MLIVRYFLSLDYRCSSTKTATKMIGPTQYSRLDLFYNPIIVLAHFLNLLTFTDCQMGSKVGWVYKPAINSFRPSAAYMRH